MKAAVRELPDMAGIELANWNWRVVRQFLLERCSVSLCRSSCLNYLHRLEFAFKRPKKRLLKADETKREAFVAEYAALWDVELEGNSNGESSVAFLEQLRERHGGRLNVIWDNAPAHRGPAMRSYLETPGLNLRLVNLPGYSPDFNADEAVWGWVREEATGNQGLGTKALVQKRVNHFLDGLASRKDEVRHRCRTVLQSKAERLPPNRRPDSWHPANGHPTLALV